MKKTLTEKCISRYRELVMKLVRGLKYFNDMENEVLTVEFMDSVKKIKERNSQIVFDAYYLPKAISAILHEDNYLTTPQTAKSRATAMMLYDLSTGELDEFYRFKNETEMNQN